MDRLQRRLAAILGADARVESGGGEITVKAGRGTPVPGRGASILRHASSGTGHEDGMARAHDLPASSSAALHARTRGVTDQEPPHWSYAGKDGPQEWHRLNPEFAKCGIGIRQSPIDIRDTLAVKMEPIRFDYRPSAFQVIDNGHTVQVNVAPGNFIEAAGRRYALRQFHFHRPSEERVSGRQFDMDVHLVHEDEQGRWAVVAVLLEQGTAHPLVQAVWNNLPLEKHEAQPGSGELDLQQLLPPERGYYMYMGSFTTPPCSEGVLWLVLKQAVPLSNEQVAIFERLYPMNARPVQPSGGRLIKATD
jgi:carbonic anhydrase